MLSNTGASRESAEMDDKLSQLSPAPTNPLLRHRRQSNAFHEQYNMCHVWTKHTPKDLCGRSRWARLRLIREMSLFSKDCDTEKDNVQLGELFRLEWRLLKSEHDLLARTEHLLDGIQGRSCILGEVNSDGCFRCFSLIEQGLSMVDRAYQSFDRILRRFDCGLALDSASATRPFSPNGTCQDCKKWYRKWSLVQLVKVWKDPPCINWCYYAQLACPHLATNRVVDFGGHPAFLCRDLDIPQSRNDDARLKNKDGISSCSCVHPCDLASWDNVPRRQLRGQFYDFFAAEEHCINRRIRCEKEREWKVIHDKDELSSSMASLAGQQPLAGYVDEQPDSLYNQVLNEPPSSSDLTTTSHTLINNHFSSHNALTPRIEPSSQRKRKKRRRRRDEDPVHIIHNISTSKPRWTIATLFIFCLLI